MLEVGVLYQPTEFGNRVQQRLQLNLQSKKLHSPNYVLQNYKASELEGPS